MGKSWNVGCGGVVELCQKAKLTLCGRKSGCRVYPA